MVAKDSEYLEQFRKAVETWTDERFLSRKQLLAAATFFLYLVNLAEEDGWSYDGHSMRVGIPICLLVVKATFDGAPYVVFTSARTTMGCVVTFMRKLAEGLLEWREDRYRQ